MKKSAVYLIIAFLVILLACAIPVSAADRSGSHGGGGNRHGGVGGGGDRHRGGGGGGDRHGGGDWHHGDGHHGGSNWYGSVWIGSGWGWGPSWWGPPYYSYYPYYPYYRYYPYNPYYPYYSEPQVIIREQAPTDAQPAPEPEVQYYWYYCQRPEGYYPYIKECPGGWMKVVPPDPPDRKE